MKQFIRIVMGFFLCAVSLIGALGIGGTAHADNGPMGGQAGGSCCGMEGTWSAGSTIPMSPSDNGTSMGGQQLPGTWSAGSTIPPLPAWMSENGTIRPGYEPQFQSSLSQTNDGEAISSYLNSANRSGYVPRITQRQQASAQNYATQLSNLGNWTALLGGAVGSGLGSSVGGNPGGTLGAILGGAPGAALCQYANYLNQCASNATISGP